MRHIGGDMARPKSTRPCTPRGIRQAAAALNGSCVIMASRHKPSGGSGCVPRTAITIGPLPPTGSTAISLSNGPNQVWLADITCVPTGEGWLYLAAVLDLCTRKIIGWAMRDHMRVELTTAALMMPIQRQKPPPGLIHHSDSGSQYAAGDYRKVIDAAGMIQSMSRKGNCWDNAPMESCFGTLKIELVHHTNYLTREEAKRDLFAYIEGYYNRQRLHSALGYITPEQAERNAA